MRLSRALGILLSLSACVCLCLPDLPAAAQQESRRVVIVGAGMAGLSAAYFLGESDFLVLEKEARVGGRARNVSWQGREIAVGAQYIGPPTGALKEILDFVGAEVREVPPPMDAAYYKGKLYVGEDELELMFIEHGGVEVFQRFVATLLNAYENYDDLPLFDFNQPLAGLDGLTARKWLELQGLPPVYLERYNVMSRGLFGANLSEISALCLLPEAAFEYEGGMPSDLPAGTACPPSKGNGGTGAYVPKGGLAGVCRELAGRMGNKVRTGCAVSKVRPVPGGGYEVAYSDAKGQKRTVAAQKVILAVPAPVALKIASEALDAERKRLLGQIHYAPYMSVALVSREPIRDEAFDLAAPDGLFFTDLYDCLWVSRLYGDPVPEDMHVTAAYCPAKGYRDRALLQMSDADVVKRVLEYLDRLMPGASAKVTESLVVRFAHAYPVMTPGAYKRLSRLNNINAGSGLVLAGDYLIYPTVEAASESGRLAAQAVGIPAIPVPESVGP